MPSTWTNVRSVLTLAWPLIISNSFWNLQMTIDRVILSQFSTDSLAASAAVMGMFWAPMALLQQTAAYVGTFVAQYWGAKETKQIGRAYWHAIYISLFGGILFLGLMGISNDLFASLGHSTRLQALEIDYFDSLCWSALPTAILAAQSGLLSGIGQTRAIIGLNAIGFGVNAVLDYILILGKWGFPSMGIAGAGIATAIANLVACAAGFALLSKRQYREPFAMRTSMGIDLKFLRQFLKYGFPSGMQWALEGLALTAFMVLLGRMAQGEASLASSGIVITIMMLAVLPALGVAQAVSILVGQHLGEKKPKEAEAATRAGVLIAATYMACMGVTFLGMPGFYLQWFSGGDNQTQLWSEVLVLVPTLMIFMAAFTTFDAINLVVSFALKGAGDTRFVTFVALLLPWPLMVGPTWLVLEWNHAIYWAWGSATLYTMTQASVFWFRFKQGKWKQMSVIHHS